MLRSVFSGIASKRCFCRSDVTTFTPIKGPAEVRTTTGRGLNGGRGATL
jgi:hypothetical protein